MSTIGSGGLGGLFEQQQQQHSIYDPSSPVGTDQSASLFGASSLFATAAGASVDLPQHHSNGGGGYDSLDHGYDSAGASGLSRHFGDVDLSSDAAAAVAAYGAFGSGTSGSAVTAGNGPSGQSSDHLGSFIGQDLVAQFFGGNGNGSGQQVSNPDLGGGDASLLSIDLLGALDGTMPSTGPVSSQSSSSPYRLQPQHQQLNLQRQMLSSMPGAGGGASMLGLDPSARVFQMDPGSVQSTQDIQNAAGSLNLPTDSASLFAPPPFSGTGTSQTQQFRSLW